MSELYPGRESMIDPHLPARDAPLMGNPVLMRVVTRRTSRGGRTIAWTAGVAAVAAVLAAGAYWTIHAAQPQPLMASAPAPPTAEQAPAMTPAQPLAPAPNVAATPAPPAPVAAVSDHPRPIIRNEHRSVASRRATVSSGQSVDDSAPASAAPPPPTSQAAQLTPVPAQAPAQAAPPVVTPPPATPAPTGP